MLLAPEDSYEKLEFDKLLERLANHCLGQPAKDKIPGITIHTDSFDIKRLLRETNEFKTSFEEQHIIPLYEYEEVSEEFKFLEVVDYVLDINQLFKISKLILMIGELYSFFTSDMKEKYPKLFDIIRPYSFNEELVHEIHRVIDHEGKIKSDASPELMRLRNMQASKQRELDRAFNRIINTYKKKGYLTDNVESFRNGRRVLSVPAEYKRQIRGIIHDESATGKTAFIEPEEIININNDIFDLKNEEKREIYRILRALSNLLRPYLDLLKEYYILIIQFDIIRAKAKLALDMDGILPKVKSQPFIGIKEGYHPLLLLKNKEEAKKTIPFNLELLNNNRILVLSGPNAGGKSICLKSLGLLQLMLQSGMLVPVDAESEMGIFGKLFVDLGDQQSLEDELSTYSSRLKNAKYFLENADETTLLLIDEFGSGTDPKIGGAIAEAMLKELNEQKVFGLVTTHYTNLKMFAYKHKGIVNGCMTFDKDTLSPTYELTIGRPGSSYAYEIAEKTGLSKKVLSYARHKTGKNEKAIDQLLVDLQKEKQELTEKLGSLDSQRKDLDRLMKNYSRMSEELSIRRKKLKLDVKQQELQDTSRSNKEMERLIKELKEEKNLEKAKEALANSKSKRKELTETVDELHGAVFTEQVSKEPIKEGDYVRLRSGGDIAKVESIRKKRAILIVNNMRMTAKVSDLVPSKPPVTAPIKGKITTDTLSGQAKFVNKIDLRGMRREEALKTLELFVDEALIANGTSLKIVHGKGDGVLRNAVKKKLREYRAVSSVYHEEAERGGDGVTIAELS